MNSIINKVIKVPHQKEGRVTHARGQSWLPWSDSEWVISWLEETTSTVMGLWPGGNCQTGFPASCAILGQNQGVG